MMNLNDVKRLYALAADNDLGWEFDAEVVKAKEIVAWTERLQARCHELNVYIRTHPRYKTREAREAYAKAIKQLQRSPLHNAPTRFIIERAERERFWGTITLDNAEEAGVHPTLIAAAQHVYADMVRRGKKFIAEGGKDRRGYPYLISSDGSVTRSMLDLLRYKYYGVDGIRVNGVRVSWSSHDGGPQINGVSVKGLVS